MFDGCEPAKNQQTRCWSLITQVHNKNLRSTAEDSEITNEFHTYKHSALSWHFNRNPT